MGERAIDTDGQTVIDFEIYDEPARLLPEDEWDDEARRLLEASEDDVVEVQRVWRDHDTDPDGAVLIEGTWLRGTDGEA